MERMTAKLVTISREYGSGGRLIGRIVAERLGVPFYDYEIINMAAKQSGLSKELIESAELRAKSSFSYTLSSAMNFGEGFGGDSMSVNEKLFLTQFDVITEIGMQGEGVIVGRCADYVLREITDVTNVFIFSEMEDRIRRCVDVYGEDEDAVISKIKMYDKARRNYYNYHTSQKWGDYTNYNLMINSSRLSIDACAEMIIDYVTKREALKKQRVKDEK